MHSKDTNSHATATTPTMHAHSLASRLQSHALLCLALLLPLTACQRTVFESPPSDSQRCDDALVGHWLSDGEHDDQDGDLAVFIDADCSLRVEERKADGLRRSTPTPLRSDRIGGERYLWVDAAWVHRSFELDAGPIDADGDVYVLAYGMHNRGQLQLFPARHRAIAHRVLDKDIPGDLVAHDDALAVRVRGDQDAIAALLRKYRLFDLSNGLDFRRVDDEDADGAPR